MQSRLYISKLGFASIPRYASRDRFASWVSSNHLCTLLQSEEPSKHIFKVANLRYTQHYLLIQRRRISQQQLVITRYPSPIRPIKHHVEYLPTKFLSVGYTSSKNTNVRICNSNEQQEGKGVDKPIPAGDCKNGVRKDEDPIVVQEKGQFPKAGAFRIRKLIIGKKDYIPIDAGELAPNYQAIDKSLSTWGTTDQPTKDFQSSESTAKSRKVVPSWISPQVLLTRYLQLDKDSERHRLWMGHRELFHRKHVPSILVEFLHNSSDSNLPDDKKISEYSKRSLSRHGFIMADLERWAQILSIQSANQRVEKFLADRLELPVFMLEAVLAGGDITRVIILDKIIAYTSGQIEAITPWQGASLTSRLLRTTNIQILFRLLYHARNILTPAIVTIAQMLPPTVSALLGGSYPENTKLNAYMHRQLCDLFNLVLDQLALPAAKAPFRSMTYAWNAQKIILEWAGQFEPPLLLNQAGYQAVSRVLAAQKKTDKESRVSSLSARTWPPWRVEQDGMDAQRILDEDFSRVVSAVIRMTESGYKETPEDSSIRILGGQEGDGTPTVHTRTVRKQEFFSEGMPFSLDDKLQWAARVEATRDVQEAWGAFTKFQQLGGKPSILMYFVMFEKLQFEKARLEFDRTSYGSRRRYLNPIPGEGKELLPPSNDNVSIFYRAQLQPPHKDELYDTMIRRDGIRPTGSFLRFLVANARTPDTAIQYLQDSLLDTQAIEFLVDGADMDPVVRKACISDQLLAAFLQMLCRFVPRINPQFQDQDQEGTPFAVSTDNLLEVLQLNTAPGKTISPLNHSIYLLTQTKPQFRPAWYAVFRALARRGTIVDKGLVGTHQNDLIAWRVMEDIINDFHNHGLELDPYGFLIICNGLEKAILASFSASNQDRLSLGSLSLQFLATEFEKITTVSTIVSTAGCAEPLHDITAVHLHAYVRVLGLVEDYEGILRVLVWMKEHNQILDERAQANRNGYVMIRRTLVAMRVFTGGTKYKTQVEEILNSSGLWSGWPSETEAEKYLERWEKLPDEHEDVLDELETQQVLEGWEEPPDDTILRG